MDPRLTQEQLMVRDTFREFVEREVKPEATRIDESGEMPRELFRRVGELGYFGMLYPEAYGGSDAGNLAYVIATEEIARGSMSLALPCAMQSLMGSYFIHRSGREDLRQEYLVPAIKGEKMGAICMTEPDAGSDLLGLRTRATRDGADWVLNGQKTWVTSGGIASHYTVFAQTSTPDGKDRLSIFLVDREAEGLTVGEKIQKMGCRAANTVQLYLDDCRIPGDRMLGEEGKGLKYLMEILVAIRVMTAGLAVGVARAAYEEARRYAGERKQFGKKIGAFQAVQIKIADMATELDVARNYTYYAAALSEGGECTPSMAAMAKLHASEAATRVCDLASRVFASYGFAAEYPVQRFYRDVRFTLIGGGTSEMLRVNIARDELG